MSVTAFQSTEKWSHLYKCSQNSRDITHKIKKAGENLRILKIRVSGWVGQRLDFQLQGIHIRGLSRKKN